MKTKLTKSEITALTHPDGIVAVRIETSAEALAYLKVILTAKSKGRKTKPVRFDFGEEGAFEHRQGTKKFAACIDDMAGALANGNARMIEVYRNMLGGVTVAAI